MLPLILFHAAGAYLLGVMPPELIKVYRSHVQHFLCSNAHALTMHPSVSPDYEAPCAFHAEIGC